MNRIANIAVVPALRSRNYRLFFFGQGVSLIGTWMTQTATIWLVYKLTNSALMLGIVGFSSQIPSFFLAVWGGVLVDRFNTHKILVIAQILAMIQSLVLAVLALSGTIHIWHFIILSLFQGVINAVDAPARQAFVPEMVEKRDDLASAIALNSSLVNGGRLVGPAIAGILIARIGAAYCFLIDGLSYIAVIAALMAMRLKPKKIVVTTANPLQRLQEGFVYAYNFSPIRSTLLLLALFSLMAMPYITLVPIFATKILGGDARTLGLLMAASGVGAIGGGIYLSTRKTVVGLGKIIALAPALCGMGIIFFSLSRMLWLSTLMSALIGLGSILTISSSNTVIQTIVEDDKRGRVMSLFTMSFLGMVPFGNLFAGFSADRIGATNTLLIGGSFCIIGSLLFARQLPKLRQAAHPILQQRGILSQTNT
ncbi:MFS transporter [Chroococcidiopsis sp. CCALA 051]|uniref:MFS transporter n=1 Tax=Chroococcidiopsis sp. CCALA 051 TaxID=869949 RepID=UPI000D0DC220|nr:MFS transporter [Chroococcidiopsis sp. CCALA 051]PSM48284.1 MFS transporter [Chroococcidiopsis sp. CCALA 051]